MSSQLVIRFPADEDLKSYRIELENGLYSFDEIVQAKLGEYLFRKKRIVGVKLFNGNSKIKMMKCNSKGEVDYVQ